MVTVFAEQLQVFLLVVARVGDDMLHMQLLINNKASRAEDTTLFFKPVLDGKSLRHGHEPSEEHFGVLAQEWPDVVWGVPEDTVGVVGRGAHFEIDDLELFFDRVGHESAVMGPTVPTRLLLTRTLSE